MFIAPLRGDPFAVPESCRTMSVLQAPRRLLVSLRDRWDAYLHPKRHATAIRRLRDPYPRHVVFVCLGNVCRSPYAAYVATRLGMGQQASVDSAGFIGPDRSPPDAALRIAVKRGTDHAGHKSKLLTTELAGKADALVIFDRYNASRMRSAFPAQTDRVFWLGDFDPVWAGKRAIIDPWGKPDEEFDVTFERIERCVTVMLEAMEDPDGGPRRS